MADTTGSNIIDWQRYQAVLFDLDGVITPTVDLHLRAWTALFEPWGFTHADYLDLVDGKPRYEGVQAFLRSRSVELPWGDPSDAPGDSTICALGNRKNELFARILTDDGVDPYPGSVAVLDALDAAKIPYAIVSSSKNARAVLHSAGIGARFEVVVDGVTAVTEGLAGKPDPAMFERAADLLGVTQAGAVVVEDASSGVAAGAAGRFGFILGVDRGGNAESLWQAGATAVVGDLAETLPPQSGARRAPTT